MHKNVKIAIGALVLLGGGYVIYNNTVAPVFTVYDFNEGTGTGTFKFGRAEGPLGPGVVYTAGWGWSAEFTTFSDQMGWSVNIKHGGTLKKVITFTSAGNY